VKQKTKNFVIVIFFSHHCRKVNCEQVIKQKLRIV